MSNRPKIALLQESELAQLLITSFFKVGKDVDLSPGKLKTLLEEVYKKQGWMYADTFSDAFSRFAACELPEAENLRPGISSLFIGKLMKLYFKRCDEKKFSRKSAKETFSQLTPEEKYNLFLKHIAFNKSLPANPDWISIYEHLLAANKVALMAEWESSGYTKKLKYAMAAVTEWTYRNYKL